jgi:hypothetical protein
MIKINIEKNPEQNALVKASASRIRSVAEEAQAAIAELMGPVLNEVINNARTISNLFEVISFGEDENPSIPIDLFYDITGDDFLTVWSTNAAGGMPYNEVFPGSNELKFTTYDLDSALAFDKKHAAKARLDVVGAVFARLAQEIILKQDKTAFNILASGLIGASTKVGSTASAAGNHIIGSTTENILTLNDFNRLITRSKRVNATFSSGTPVGGAQVGITDLMVSPEMIEQIRSMAYQPVNTRSGAVTTSGASSIAAPESLRSELFNSAGIPSFYGINIVEILELGVNLRFNKIFGALDTGNDVVGGGGSGTFDATADEILIGIDRNRRGLLRPSIREEGSDLDLSLVADDQHRARSKKIGYYGSTNQGWVCAEDRALSGLVC